jgi:EmrB/QacA subfamily drug resistance transporter
MPDQTLATEAPAAGAPSRSNPRIVALIVACSMFMDGVDSTVLAVALPTMAQTFGADPLHMSVALTSYLLSLAIFIPISGKMADRFGSRTVFRGAIGLFTVGSVLCSQANSLAFLVGARILQGVGGAMMVPVGRLVLLRSVSKADLVRAMSWLMIPASIGPIMGPPIGGFIVTYLSWKWIFYINVPIGLLGMAMSTRYIEEVRVANPGRFDLVGFVLTGTALSTLIFALEFGSRGVGSGRMTELLIGIGVVAAVLYLLHARKQEQPILDMRLMRIPTFRISVLAGTLSRIAVGASPFLLPMLFQLGFGMSAAQSGGITFAGSVGSLAMRSIAPRLLRRIGFRNTLVWVGAASTCVFASYAAFRQSWPVPVMFGILMFGGFVQSLQFMAYNTIAYADVPRREMSSATAFYTTFQQLSLSLGIGFSAAVLAMTLAMAGSEHLQPAHFSIAFLSVAAIAIMAPLLSTLLARDAGEELTR